MRFIKSKGKIRFYLTIKKIFCILQLETQFCNKMLDINNSVFIIIDLQERLLKSVKNNNIIVKNANSMLKGCGVLNIPAIITEQYPNGLGHTDECILLQALTQQAKIIEKTTFSIMQTPAIKEYFLSLKKKQVIICGVETHICVLQSVIDLLNDGYEVFVIDEASSSYSDTDHKTAIEYMKTIGAKIWTIEMLLFDFVQSSKHKDFKEIQNIVKAKRV